jgi:STE24 endopeptidase
MLKHWAAIIAAVVICSLAVTVTQADAFDPQAATEAYLGSVEGEARAKSDAYFEGGYWLILWNALASIGVALLLLFTRASAGMRNLAERMTERRGLQTFLYGLQFIAVTSILTFPLAYWQDFVREHEFGLSNLTREAWLTEYAIGFAVNLVMTSVFLVALYGIIRRTGEVWWLWATGLTVGFFVFSIAISPVFIAPLFNEYKPMREGPLKEEILAMARANGVPADNVYEFNASKQSKRISANVSGFLGTTRISLNDNLLDRGTPAEVRAVMAHEIGHYVLGHMYEIILTLAVLAAVAFIFIDIGFGTLHALFGRLWGVRDFGDTAGLPIIVIMFSLFGLLSTPVTNSITRANEAEADIFGLNTAREPDGFATIALKLAEYRKLDPTPWEEVVFYTHPSARSRIYMAMQWKAEQSVVTPAQPESASLAPRLGQATDPVPEFVPPEFAPIDGEAEPPAFQDFPAAIGDR